jgi:hypothetical protein
VLEATKSENRPAHRGLRRSRTSGLARTVSSRVLPVPALVHFDLGLAASSAIENKPSTLPDESAFRAFETFPCVLNRSYLECDRDYSEGHEICEEESAWPRMRRTVMSVRTVLAFLCAEGHKLAGQKAPDVLTRSLMFDSILARDVIKSCRKVNPG